MTAAAPVAHKETKTMSTYEQLKALADADEVGQFEFKHVGYRCFVVRRDKDSNWCGYVLLPNEHPWTKEAFPDADVHGGVTWNKPAEHVEGAVGCHLVGFDTSHLGDFMASPFLKECWNGTVWRNKAYVEKECRRLADQAGRAMYGGKR